MPTREVAPKIDTIVLRERTKLHVSSGRPSYMGRMTQIAPNAPTLTSSAMISTVQVCPRRFKIFVARRIEDCSEVVDNNPDFMLGVVGTGCTFVAMMVVEVAGPWRCVASNQQSVVVLRRPDVVGGCYNKVATLAQGWRRSKPGKGLWQDATGGSSPAKTLLHQPVPITGIN